MGIHRGIAGTLTRAAATASGTQSVSCGGLPLMVFFSVMDNADPGISSNGWDYVTKRNCNSRRSLSVLVNLIGTLGVASNSTMLNTCSINTSTIGGDGHSGLVTSFDQDGFTITWTKLGAGRDITIEWSAIL